MEETILVISVSSEEEFDKISKLVKAIGCEVLLNYHEIPSLKTLFINQCGGDVKWSHRPVEEYLSDPSQTNLQRIDMTQLEKLAITK